MVTDPPTSAVPRRRFGTLLWRLADLVQAAERRRSFRARAFQTAVWALDGVSADLHDRDEEMAAVEGIGPGIVRLADEFRRTGTIAELDRLAERFPAESSRMRRLPRITPGRLEAMKQGLGIDTVADLMEAIQAGAAETIEGVGPATVDRWEAILAMPPEPGAVPAHDGAVIAGRFRRHLLVHLRGDEVMVAGAVRRLDEWVGCVDLVVVTADPQRAARFLEQTAVVRSSAVEPGWRVDMVSHEGVDIVVVLASPETQGSALVRATGPERHVASLGLGTDPQPTEPAVYASAGRRWVPPPARASPSPRPDRLVTVDDLAGDLHVHSESSPDGHMDLDEIGLEASSRGYEYVVLTDHTAGLRFGGLDAAALYRQRGRVEDLRTRFPDLAILHGAEMNIDRDGRPDLDDETLAWLDLVVAGCHSHFDLPRPAQTARLVAAVRHPSVRVLAHPTGRRIGIRPAIDVDLAVVYAAAVDAATALEVNGHRDRMDLSATHAAEAAAAGVLLAADSDAHRLHELDNVGVATGVLQKGGVEPESVVNTWSLAAFRDWLER